MYEQDVVVTTKHGRMPAFVAAPDSGGPHPGVIFYMDAPGTREELRNMARRIARNGYVCLLPDMYYRLGTVRFDTPRRDDAMSGVIRASMNSITNALVTDDTAAMLAWFDANDRVSPGPVGCVGHCMSGCYITTVSARFPHRMKAAASLYGVNIVTDKPDSSHLLLPQVKGELYYAFAEHDQSVPAHVIPDLQESAGGDGCGEHGQGVRRHASRLLLRRTRGVRRRGVGADLDGYPGAVQAPAGVMPLG